MSNHTAPPFAPDQWWPDLFAQLDDAERDEVVNDLAIMWHEGWHPNRADAADLIDVRLGRLTPLQAAHRAADRTAPAR